jgi:hypothetical protein
MMGLTGGWGCALASLVLGFSHADAQNFNPPFPRIGVIYFYEANIPQEIWKYHDLIVTRFWYPEIAREIKKYHPEKIVVACNNIIDGNTLKEASDQWLVPTVDGSCLPGWHNNAHPGNCLYDGTDRCPQVNGRRWNDYLGSHLSARTDWTVFDGTFWDSWAGSIEWMSNYGKVDFDRNGVADYSQSKTMADDLWREGNKLIVNKMRALTPPGKITMAHEASAKETGYLNGIGMEGWTGEDWQWRFEQILLPFANSAVTPRVNFVEGKGNPEDFQRMRFLLTTACLAGAYFGMDEGASAHRWTYIFDEYLADLGYPTGDPKQIKPGVWVRYFDNGVVITNGSGKVQTVSSAELQGGPYHRFLGGQVPGVNNGQPFSAMTMAGSGADNTRNQTGDGILLLKEPKVLITEITVDNVRRNMTSPNCDAAVFTGAWQQQEQGKVMKTKAYALNYGWDEFGAPYAFTSAGNGENRAVYTPTIGVAGEYEVFEWHPFHGNDPNEAGEATSVQCFLKHRDGTETITIDQSRDQCRWNSLGKFRFNAGTSDSFTITNKAAGGVVLADAIKFVNTATQLPPPTGGGGGSDIVPPSAPAGVRVKTGN